MGLGLYDENGYNTADKIGSAEFKKREWISQTAERALLDQIQSNPKWAKIDNVPQWNDNIVENVDDVREQMLLAAKNLRNSVTVG
jgi:beta-N-acetylglucosaminidase